MVGAQKRYRFYVSRTRERIIKMHAMHTYTYNTYIHIALRVYKKAKKPRTFFYDSAASQTSARLQITRFSRDAVRPYFPVNTYRSRV